MYYGMQKTKKRGAMRCCLWLVAGRPRKGLHRTSMLVFSVFRWSAEDRNPHGSNTGVSQKRCWALTVLGLGGVLLLLHIRKPVAPMGSVVL